MTEIPFYQIEGSIVRFIYRIHDGETYSNYLVASCENYLGMVDFATYCGRKSLEGTADIHKKCKELNEGHT